MTGKEQKEIHKLFADEVLDTEDSADKYEDAITQFPELKGKISVDSFRDPAYAVMGKDSIDICKYFAIEVDTEGELKFHDGEHFLSVKETVAANVNDYNRFKELYEAEESITVEMGVQRKRMVELNDYRNIYSALMKQLEKYFDLAAEDILADVYGDAYTKFKQDYLDAKKAEEEEEAAEE